MPECKLCEYRNWQGLCKCPENVKKIDLFSETMYPLNQYPNQNITYTEMCCDSANYENRCKNFKEKYSSRKNEMKNQVKCLNCENEVAVHIDPYGDGHDFRGRMTEHFWKETPNGWLCPTCKKTHKIPVTSEDKDLK
jgi:hypothetical protein